MSSIKSPSHSALDPTSEITKFDLSDVPATREFVNYMVRSIRPGQTVFLRGEMGAGKSHFARAFLRAVAEDDALEVPSPTFSIVQSYDLTHRGAPLNIHHFDLWRLNDPQDMLELGWEEEDSDVLLVEWPDKGGEFLPDPDWELNFFHDGEKRAVSVKELGRA